MEIPKETLLDSDTAHSESPNFEELAESYRSLRTLFNVVLVLMVILTGSFFVFLLREVSIVRRKVNGLTQLVVNYETTRQPVLAKFQRELQEFGKTNPDFKPILEKYFGNAAAISPAPATGAPTPSGSGMVPLQVHEGTNVARMPPKE